jgi:hypothetical protein
MTSQFGQHIKGCVASAPATLVLQQQQHKQHTQANKLPVSARSTLLPCPHAHANNQVQAMGDVIDAAPQQATILHNELAVQEELCHHTSEVEL